MNTDSERSFTEWPGPGQTTWKWRLQRHRRGLGRGMWRSCRHLQAERRGDGVEPPGLLFAGLARPVHHAPQEVQLAGFSRPWPALMQCMARSCHGFSSGAGEASWRGCSTTTAGQPALDHVGQVVPVAAGALSVRPMARQAARASPSTAGCRASDPSVALGVTCEAVVLVADAMAVQHFVQFADPRCASPCVFQGPVFGIVCCLGAGALPALQPGT
jgi:hypothetical protein